MSKPPSACQFDIGAVLEAIKERGEIITKVAYGDWKRAGDYGRAMAQHAVRLVQRVMTPGGDKNGADINLALDALEMAFTHDHINAFVIVGGDSDFITLVEKLKQYDKKVFVVGGRAFTSQVMQKNCTEFIAYENVAGSSAVAARAARARRERGARPAPQLARSGVAARQARAEGADRPRSVAAARAAQEHAAAARLVVLRARLRRRARSAISPRSSSSAASSRSSTRAAPRSSSSPTPERVRGASTAPSCARRDVTVGIAAASAREDGGRATPSEPRGAGVLAGRRRRAGSRGAGRGDDAAALADVSAPDEAVHPRGAARFRRAALRIAARSAARVPEGRPAAARTRSAGRAARVCRRRPAVERPARLGEPRRLGDSGIGRGRQGRRRRATPTTPSSARSLSLSSMQPADERFESPSRRSARDVRRRLTDGSRAEAAYAASRWRASATKAKRARPAPRPKSDERITRSSSKERAARADAAREENASRRLLDPSFRGQYTLSTYPRAGVHCTRRGGQRVGTAGAVEVHEHFCVLRL